METGEKKENWIKKLSEAEAAHSDAVWEGIELQLNKDEEVKHLRKTVIMYKWLAAACVSFALLSGAYTYFGNNADSSLDQRFAMNNTNVAAEETIQSSSKSETATITATERSEHAGLNENSINVSSYGNQAYPKQIVSSGEMPTGYSTEENAGITYSAPSIRMTNADYGKSLKEVLPNSAGGYASFGNSIFSNQSTSEAAAVQSPLLKDEKQLIAALTGKEESEEKEEKKGSEQFWTAVGFAAGTFSNTTPTSPLATASALDNSFAGQTAASESNSPGYTYAVNLLVGTKVSERWVLQGGMSYITQSSDYTATSVIADPVQQTLTAASINGFEKKEDTKANILTTSPYTVNNNIQLISFPMQAGFIVMDRKVGFQINSGFSTDLFLQNTITPQVENLEKSTQGRGDDSPYKAFNISGLVGTELSYRFGDHYRLALSPGLRYPFSSIYKSDLGVKSSPLTFDVAVRFRYILK